MAIDKADFAVLGKMFGELMALDLSNDTTETVFNPFPSMFDDTAREFVKRYLPRDDDPDPDIRTLKASQVVLSGIVDAVFNHRLDLQQIILKTAKALLNPRGVVVEELRAQVVYVVAEQKYRCDFYASDEVKRYRTRCADCNALYGIPDETCPGCGQYVGYGVETRQLRCATRLIRNLEDVTPKFREAKLEPEYVRRELIKRGRSWPLISAVLSIRAGAFGDDVRAKEIQEQGRSFADAARTIAKSFDASANKRIPDDALDLFLTSEQREKKREKESRMRAKRTPKAPT